MFVEKTPKPLSSTLSPRFKALLISLSIKLLEEIDKKEALEKYGSEGSGKNLPFSSLSEDLKKKEEKK